LIDANGNNHHVTFNKSLTLPLLTKDWTKLRDFYHFEGKQQILMTYIGQSRFILTIGKKI